MFWAAPLDAMPFAQPTVLHRIDAECHGELSVRRNYQRAASCSTQQTKPDE